MPGYKNKTMRPKKMSGKAGGVKMSGKGMPRGNKSGGPSMKSKGR